MNFLQPDPRFVHLGQKQRAEIAFWEGIIGKYVAWYEDTRRIAKDITYGNIKTIQGDKLIVELNTALR